MPSLAWLGERQACLDQSYITACGPLVLGCYGGTTSVGASKNEDAAWLLCNTEARWELAVLLDAHATSQSATLIVQWCEQSRCELEVICQQPSAQALPTLATFLVQSFSDRVFRQNAHAVQGETAVLIVFRTGQWLYWFSVGDCVVYLLHPDFTRLGQYGLNQRQFYEWIGHVNTFDQEIPCFTSGVRALRDGLHTVVMITDGVLECGERLFDNPARLAQVLMPADVTPVEISVQAVLDHVRVAQGRDSATLIAWRCDIAEHHVPQPSQ